MMSENISAGRAPVHEARSHGESVARSPQFEWLARAGLVARGVVYATVGVLAVELALGDGGKTTDQQGALATIARQPFGKVLLILVAIGLAGYSIWRLTRAALGHGPEADDDGKERVAGLASGIAYGLLCVTAVKIVAGSGGGSSGPGKAAGGVLDWPAGPWLVALAGAIVVGVGLEQGYKGIKKKFLEKSKTEEMGARMRKLFTAIGVFGHLSRMVVFCLIGYFLIRAAIDYDPDKAVGLDGAPGRRGRRTRGLRRVLGARRALPEGLALIRDRDGSRRRRASESGH
jgi:hypothetical protein